MSIALFIRRFLLFLVLAAPFITAQSLYTYFDKSYEQTVNGSEIYTSLHKSKVKKKVKVLIIGDSVGEQLYDNHTYNDEIYSLTTNQAISLAGYYILLKNFTDINSDSLPEQVILILHPETFTNNLDQKFTFHYFLKPFYKPENKPLLTTKCLEQIRKIPFNALSQFPFILNTNWAPDYQPGKDTTYRLISPISNDYIIKINKLCIQKHIAFKLYSPPVRSSSRNLIAKYASGQNECIQCNLTPEFQNYFKNIQYFSDTLFQDHIHFKKQYIPNDILRLKTK